MYMCKKKSFCIYIYINVHISLFEYMYISYTRWHNIVQYTVGNKHRLMAYIICNYFDTIDLFYLSERLQGMKHMYHLFSSCPTCGVQEHTGPKKKSAAVELSTSYPLVTIFNEETMEHHHFSWESSGKLMINGHFPSLC